MRGKEKKRRTEKRKRERGRQRKRERKRQGRKDGKELGPLGQDASSKVSKKKSSSGLRGTLNVFAHGTKLGLSELSCIS